MLFIKKKNFLLTLFLLIFIDLQNVGVISAAPFIYCRILSTFSCLTPFLYKLFCRFVMHTIKQIPIFYHVGSGKICSTWRKDLLLTSY